MKNHKTSWLLGMAAAATLPLAIPAQAQIFGLSEAEEIRAGQQVAAQAQKEYGRALPSTHPMARRVRSIGAQFARLSGRRNIPYSYTVLQNDKVLNAFAAPGGPVFVTTRLVKATTNDAELAYVLGHETAHIDRKHIVEQVEKQQKASVAAGILGAILGRRGGSNTIGAIANVGWAVVSRGHSRDDEREADIVGVRWMSQLGYDPRAAISMLGKLGGGSGGGISKYLSTHPAPKDRQTLIQNTISKENLLQVAQRAGGPRLSSDFGDGFNYSDYPLDDSDNRYPDGGYDSDNRYPDSYATSANEIDFGRPLRLRSAISGSSQVIMAPVSGFARWAGATVSTRGDNVIVRRASYTVDFERNSNIAYLNNRSVRMSTAAVDYSSSLYAPLGLLAEGLGGRASVVTLSDGSRAAQVTIGSRSGIVRY
jgi:Zn-dependent protease with chaperone function